MTKCLHLVFSDRNEGDAPEFLRENLPSLREVKTRKVTGVSADQMAKIEWEMGNLQEQFKLTE